MGWIRGVLDIAQSVENSRVHEPATARRRPMLLVSVRDVTEAKIARDSGAVWIDLKDPSAGSLGAPPVETAREVSEFLTQWDRKSVALGELMSIDIDQARRVAELFPVAKVGLSGLAVQPGWQGRFVELGKLLRATTQLVPVAYADSGRCAAPEFTEILKLAVECELPFLLVDTYTKDGQGLLSHCSSKQIASWIHDAESRGIEVVLAGSLTLDDWLILSDLKPFAFAVRGAVCSGHRDSAIDASKVRDWSLSLSGVS